MKAFCSFGLVCVSAFLACEWIAAPALAAATLEKEGLTTPDLSAIRAKASVHGPYRNDPAQGIPKHAYSPFDDINQPPPRQPAPGRDYLEGQLVIKFRP